MHKISKNVIHYNNTLHEIHQGACGGHLGQENILASLKNNFTGLGTSMTFIIGARHVLHVPLEKLRHQNSRPL